MTTSEVSIANLALSMLGDEPIISLTEDNSNARVMNLWYEPIRDAVLQSHPWNSVAARAQLSADSTAPVFGFTYQYQLPSDLLRLVQFNDGKTPFRIEGKKLLTNAAPARVRYVRKETDPNAFEPLLVLAIAAHLAYSTAVQVTGDVELESQMKARYDEYLQQARGVDAQQGPLEVFEASDWVDARYDNEYTSDGIYRPIEDV